MLTSQNTILLERREIDTFKLIYKIYFEAFPDSHTLIEHILADGRKVAVFSITNATNKREYMGQRKTYAITAAIYISIRNKSYRIVLCGNNSNTTTYQNRKQQI